MRHIDEIRLNLIASKQALDKATKAFKDSPFPLWDANERRKQARALEKTRNKYLRVRDQYMNLMNKGRQQCLFSA